MRNSTIRCVNERVFNANHLDSKTLNNEGQEYMISMVERNNKFITLLILAVGFLLRFVYLGDGELYTWDDATYAHVADGLKDDPLHPKVMGTTDVIGGIGTPGKYFELPPITLWLIALSFRIFGVSPFAARLPVAILGFIAIWLIGQLAKELSTDRRFGEYASVFAMALFMIEPLIIEYSRRAMHEIPLITWQILTLIFFIRAIKVESNSNRNAIIAGFFLGIGFLTKYHTVFGIILFIIYIGVIQFASKKNNKTLKTYIRIYSVFFLIFLLTIGCWLLNIYMWEPSSLSWIFNWLVLHSTTIIHDVRHPLQFYFDMIFQTGIGPLLIFVILSLQYYEKYWFRMLLSWFVPVFIILTYSLTKYPWFTIYLIPPLILLAAFGMAEDLVEWGGKKVFLPGIVMLSIKFAFYTPVPVSIRVSIVGVLLCLPFLANMPIKRIVNFKLLTRIKKIPSVGIVSILLVTFIFINVTVLSVTKKSYYYPGQNKPGLKDMGLFIKDRYPNSKIFVEESHIHIDIRFYIGHYSGIQLKVTPLAEIQEENALIVTYMTIFSQFSSNITNVVLYSSGDYVLLLIGG